MFFEGNPAMTHLTVATMGGIHTERMGPNLFKPFQDETGVEIKSVAYNSLDFNLKQPINQHWDVMDLTMADYQKAVDQNYLASLPQNLFEGNNNQFLEGALKSHGVASIIWSKVFAFNTQVFKEKEPRTVFDVWDTETFPGMRAFPAQAEGTLELALMADNVAREEVHTLLRGEEGLQRALNKLKELGKSILWFPDYTSTVDALMTGKAVMASAPCGRFSHAIKEGKPLKIFWDHQIYGYNYWGVMESSPYKKEAFEFLKYIMNPVRHAHHLNEVHYGAVCATAQKHIHPENIHYMPLDPINCRSSLPHDPDLWATRGSELNERFLKAFGLESLKAA